MKNDLVVMVSSGNSSNVVKLKYCKKIKTIFTVFSKLKKMTDLNLHLNLKTYGQTEILIILMHMIMHYIIKDIKIFLLIY